MMITPALTAEAWASIAARNGLPYAYGSSILDDIGMLEGSDIPAAIAYLNAALPDGDLRKITWGMVDELDETLEWAKEAEDMASATGSWRTSEMDARYETWKRLRDILASYLPPREVAPGFHLGEIVTGTVDAQGQFVPGPIPQDEHPVVGRVTEISAESITISFAPESPPRP